MLQSSWFKNRHDHKSDLVPYINGNNKTSKPNEKTYHVEQFDSFSDEENNIKDNLEYINQQNMLKKRKKKKKLSKSNEQKISLTDHDCMRQNAALVVHERVIMVAPNLTMTRNNISENTRTYQC